MIDNAILLDSLEAIEYKDPRDRLNELKHLSIQEAVELVRLDYEGCIDEGS